MVFVLYLGIRIVLNLSLAFLLNTLIAYGIDIIIR